MWFEVKYLPKRYVLNKKKKGTHNIYGLTVGQIWKGKHLHFVIRWEWRYDYHKGFLYETITREKYKRPYPFDESLNLSCHYKDYTCNTYIVTSCPKVLKKYRTTTPQRDILNNVPTTKIPVRPSVRLARCIKILTVTPPFLSREICDGGSALDFRSHSPSPRCVFI